MQTTPRIIGNHVFFFRDGAAFTSPAAGTASRTAKPDQAETTWVDLGVINNLEVDPQFDEKEIFTPSPGQLRLYDVLQTKRKLNLKWECEELQKLSAELAFGAAAVSGAGPHNYNPLAGGVVKGWIRVQQYDQNDALVNTVEVYVRLKLAAALNFNDDIAKTSMEATVLHSTLNQGTLAA